MLLIPHSMTTFLYAQHTAGSILSIVGAQKRCPGMRSPKVFLLSEPKFKLPVLESPIMQVELLFHLLTDLNVRLYLVPFDKLPDFSS